MSHVLYTREDFTEEEAARENVIYMLVVKDGVKICRKCGRVNDELIDDCGKVNYNKGYFKWVNEKEK